jgi:hypothetical protein
MDAGPDHSLVLRRAPRPAGRIDGAAPPPSAPAGDIAAYSSDEIALARAERDARRTPTAALDDDWFAPETPASPAGAAPSAPSAPTESAPVAAPAEPPAAVVVPAAQLAAERTLAFGLPLSEADLGVFDEETAQMDLDQASALAGFDLRSSRTEDDALEAVAEDGDAADEVFEEPDEGPDQLSLWYDTSAELR